jgi:hypothetical protein
MDHLAQLVFVGSTSDRSLKHGRNGAASEAFEAFQRRGKAHAFEVDVERFAAARAERALLRRDGRTASLAYRKTAEMRERVAADAAAGWEGSCYEIVKG